jgi:hypothetical protein
MPANILNPDSFENLVRSLIAKECALAAQPNNIQIEVFDFKKLENLGLKTES